MIVSCLGQPGVYECGICEKRVKKAASLLFHMRIHSAQAGVRAIQPLAASQASYIATNKLETPHILSLAS
jgi:hypothetical protein